MSTLTFKAVIDGIHYDPKKGVVKIQLVASSHVSIDKLVTLCPSAESIDVILQSSQTKIGTFTPNAKDAEVPSHDETDEERLDRERENERGQNDLQSPDPKDEEIKDENSQWPLYEPEVIGGTDT